MKPTKYLGFSSGKLIKGCQECVLGNKTVLFITGKCERKCYYCPLPESRKNLDVVYANERKLSSPNAVGEAIEEARLCSSKGIGITGGNPLCALQRTLKFTRAFKKAFGKSFHIHIYLPTDIAAKDKLEKLAKAGIDEIRFHPYFLSKDAKGLEAIENAWNLKKKYKWQVGIEIPSIPGTACSCRKSGISEHPKNASVFFWGSKCQTNAAKTIQFLKTVKNIDFLNLNEFEMPSLGGESLLKRGMSTVGNSVAIKGSEKTALNILSEIAKSRPQLNIHYCSAATKNLFQFKNRLKRRLQNVKKPYDIITKDFDLFHAAIYLPRIIPSFSYEKKLEKLRAVDKTVPVQNKIISKLGKLRKVLMKEFNIPSKLIEVDRQFLRILTTPEIKKVSDKIKAHKVKVALVTELPTYDRIILNLEWL